MKHSTIFNILTLASVLALSACGGGGGGGGNDDPAEPPTPAPPSTPDPVEPVSATFEKSLTTMGSTFSVDGMVTLLRNDADELSLENLDMSGFTLYTFDDDPLDSSVCSSETCIDNWPPLVATDSDTATAPLSIVTRDDGNRQWALRGKPLYFFAGDSAAGEVNGEGVGGVWDTALAEPIAQANGASEGVYFAASGRIGVSVMDSDTVFSAAQEDRLGFALYTFDVDAPGVSNCNDTCLDNWPALLAEEGDIAEPPYSLVERKLGSDGETALQWAYQEMPLYFYKGDTAPGSTLGDGLGDVWHLARPQNTQVIDSERGSTLAVSGLAMSTDDDAVEPEAVPLHGFALYTFDPDNSDVSNCSDDCLAAWPALIAYPGAVATPPFSLVERSPGVMQWAVNGKPLYTFASDVEPGDVTGDGVGDVWHLARFAPVAVATVTLDGEEIPALTAHGDLIDESGMPSDTYQDYTLYTFDDDTDGVSTCFGGCAAVWPPLFARADARDFGDFTVTRRDDPSTTSDDDSEVYQWAYKGEPLYFYASDSGPGDTAGEYGTWHVAVP